MDENNGWNQRKGEIDFRLKAVELHLSDLARTKDLCHESLREEIAKLRERIVRLETKIGVYAAVSAAVVAGVLKLIEMFIGVK